LKAKGNAPAASKYAAIQALGHPLSFGDLHMLVGLFGFYSRWIPWFECWIRTLKTPGLALLGEFTRNYELLY
jgi:hypothetical protein